MTDTSTVNRRNTGQHTRGTSERPRSSGGFNPLHPSKELPPEQLIRLLGLEDKKARKKKTRTTAPTKTAARADSNADSKPVAKPVAEPIAKAAAKPATNPAGKRRTPGRSASAAPAPMWADPPVGRSHRKPGRRHGKTTPKRKQRSVLGWAAAIGGLAGVAVSVYLFWGQSTPDRIASPAPAPAQKAPASKTPVPAVAPVPRRAPASRVQDQPTDDSKWKARTEAREQQLRAKAQQRFREHMEETQRLAGQPAPAANTTQSEPARTAQDPSAAPAGASSAGTAIPQAGIQAQPPEVTEPMLPEAVDRPAEPVSAPTAESAPSPIPAAPVSATPEESTPVAEPPIPAPEATIDPAASAPPAATQPLANPEPLPSADEVEPDVTEPAQPGASVPAPGATIEEPAADEAPGGNTGETMTAPPSAVDTGEADPPASL